MKVPVEAVQAMKRTFQSAAELRRFAEQMDIHFTKKESERMWRGNFRGIALERVEGWWLMCGYRLTLRADKRL